MLYFCRLKIKFMSKITTVKTIEQNDNVSLYSICFSDNELSEYIIKKLKNPLFKIKKYIFRQKYKAVF